MYNKVGYLGPEGSYSHLAAQKMCPNAQCTPYENFNLVIKALTDRNVDCVVLPIENTLNGGVLQNIDILQYTPNIIAVKECALKIDHRLITLAGADKSKITTIYSHQQALAQCSKFISTNFPKAKLIATTSTVACINYIKTPYEAGIVGGHLCIDGYEMSKECVSDEPNNLTYFLLIERGTKPKSEQTERIYFSFTCCHRPGELLNMLNIISRINMTKIESRPIKDKPGEYRFFVEAEANYSSEDTQKIICNLKHSATSFKLLGAY